MTILILLAGREVRYRNFSPFRTRRALLRQRAQDWYIHIVSKEYMTYSCLRSWMSAHKELELLPTKRLALAAPIEPFKHYPNRFISEVLYTFGIRGHSIILYVSFQFLTKSFPYFLQRCFISDFLRP